MLQNGNIVFSDVVKELLKAFRGKRSQLALSRRLQYTFNQVGKWEAGHTKIRWDEFVRLCKICQVPLDRSLRIHYKYQGSPQNCAAIIEMIIESHNVSEVSKKTGLSRHSLASWIKSKSFPTLQEMFQILSLFRGGEPHLISFIASLVKSPEGLPSILEVSRQRQSQIDFAYKHPWLSAVVDCLALESYQKLSSHKKGFVAHLLRISLSDEQRALDFLKTVGVINSKNEKYQATGKKLFFQENILEKPSDIEGNFQLREYWWGQALQHLKERPSWATLTFAFQTIAVSETAFRKIRALSVQYFKDVTKVIEEDPEPKTLLRVMNLCFFDPSGRDSVK